MVRISSVLRCSHYQLNRAIPQGSPYIPYTTPKIITLQFFKPYVCLTTLLRPMAHEKYKIFSYFYSKITNLLEIISLQTFITKLGFQNRKKQENCLVGSHQSEKNSIGGKDRWRQGNVLRIGSVYYIILGNYSKAFAGVLKGHLVVAVIYTEPRMVAI